MHAFRIDDMTCGRCAARIARALRALDATADLRVDLARRELAIDTRAGLPAVEAAIREAGHAPRRIAPSPARPVPAAAGGCCCGSRARAAG